MARLYRSSTDPQHWLVFSDDCGWVRFPAKVGGWKECRPMATIARQSLQRVPVRQAFNTGLLESLKRRGLDRAA
jgi:hypothetical protein